MLASSWHAEANCQIEDDKIIFALLCNCSQASVMSWYLKGCRKGVLFWAWQRAGWGKGGLASGCDVPLQPWYGGLDPSPLLQNSTDCFKSRPHDGQHSRWEKGECGHFTSQSATWMEQIKNLAAAAKNSIAREKNDSSSWQTWMMPSIFVMAWPDPNAMRKGIQPADEPCHVRLALFK